MSRLEEIKQFAEHNELDFRSYSGRGMFGRKCPAVVVEDYIPILELAGSCGIFNAKVDNMGQGFVIYWPRVEWKDA